MMYKKYKDVLENSESLYKEEEIKEMLDCIEKLHKGNYEIVLNSYHFSNLVGIKWKTLEFIINNMEKNYYNFNISKKSGGTRKINVPTESLATCQKFIKENILDMVPIHDSANGFANCKSIITNAQMHINQEMILNIDLKDFFPSIDSKKVFYVFHNLCGYSTDLSYCFTKLVMYNGGLPQGACTSPVLSNIVSFKMDIRLSNLAKKMGLTYTRYADDITFSGPKEKVNDGLLRIVTQIINESGYEINNKKTRFQSYKIKQEVTGLIVSNGVVSVPKNYIKKIRQELYYIKKFGIIDHKIKSNINNRFYKEHLKGKIMFVYSINKVKGSELLKQYNSIFDN